MTRYFKLNYINLIMIHCVIFFGIVFFGIEKTKGMTNGTYNSFIKQIGYCKMQSFLTESRSTSESIEMFKDGRVKFGVGISDIDMQKVDYEMCGMCLNITHIDRFYDWNFELTQWDETTVNDIHTPFIAMVFDRCPDEICIHHFLDFDIYNPLQPVMNGNPQNIEWNFIPCPIKEGEFIEYLICTSDTCNAQNKEMDLIENVIEIPVYFWTITFRNMRLPIKQVWVTVDQKLYELKKENAWTWDGDVYDLKRGIEIVFTDSANKTWNDSIEFDVKKWTHRGYNGGILMTSNIQN